MNSIKKNVLLSATALGLVFSFNANADTTITKEALLADLNDTTYTDGSFDTSMGKQYVSGGDWSDEYAQYKFDSNNDGEADASLSGKTLGDTSIDFTQEAFQFTDQNGDTTDLSEKPTGLNTTDFDKAATIIAAEVGTSSHSGNNLGTTTTVTQDTYSYMADTTGTGTPTAHTLTDNAPALTDFSKTITLTGSQNHGDVVVTGDSDDGMPQQSDYTFIITKADNTESGKISWVKTGSSYTINASVEGDLDNDADMAAAIAQAKLEFQAYSNDVTAFNNAKATNATNLDTATSNYNTVNNAYTADAALQESITTNYNNYTTSYSTADTNRIAAKTALNDTFTQYTTDVNKYTTAKAAVDAYDNSISAAVDNRSQNQISESLKDGGAVKTAIDNAVAYDNTTSGLEATTMQDAIDENVKAIADEAERADAAEKANAKAIADEAERADAAEKANAKAIADETERADAAEKANAKAIADEAERADAAEKANAKAIADEAERATTAETNLDKAIKAEVKRATGIEGDMANLEATYSGNLAAKGSTIAEHFAAVDTRMGKINNLFDGSKVNSTTVKSTTGAGSNLAKGTTVEDHLVSIDNAIGDRTNLGSKNASVNSEVKTSVAAGLKAAGDAIGDADFSTTKYAVGATDLSSAIRQLDTSMAETQAHNDARFAAIDNRIDGLRKEMRQGLAATSALAGLVPLDNSYKTQLSMAMGGYEDKQAVALGGFHYIKDNIILNAGVAYGGSKSTAYKVGVTFGF
ncbi:MAG: YadA-like family protein [Alphaproteobacteria bacterium]|nr:YadA-like family protein [Alphaproteobacteria bacterium]